MYILFVSVVIVISAYTIAMETLYLAKKEGMINGEFAFILFELDQLTVSRNNNLKFFWFIYTSHVFR